MGVQQNIYCGELFKKLLPLGRKYLFSFMHFTVGIGGGGILSRNMGHKHFHVPNTARNRRILHMPMELMNE